MNKMKVPFMDLKRAYERQKKQIDEEIQKVIDNTAFAGGKWTQEFEEDFASYCQVNHAVGVNSGTDALHLAMRALGIGKGDKVILPANSFIATAWGPSYVDATPVFVDCDEYYNIDVEQVRSAITEDTRAVIAVHLYGQPCNVEELKEITKSKEIWLIEDAAQAHGAKFKDTRVGGFGEIGCFSFYPGKNLGAFGEGGACTTNNPDYAEHIARLRNHGSVDKYYHVELGFNMRMDGIQGAVLKTKLRLLDKNNARRREIAGRYLNGIKNVKIELPEVREGAEPVWHLFVIQTEERDNFRDYLDNNSISSGLHYPEPLHMQKAYAHLGYKEGDFPRTENLAARCVSLPVFPEMTDEEVEYVIETVNNY